jgi:hypothetical protein
LFRIGLPQATASTVAVGEIEVSCTASSGQRESTGFVPLVLPASAAGNDRPHPDIALHLTDLQVHQLNNQQQDAMDQKNAMAVTKAARDMAQHVVGLGAQAKEKTVFVQQMADKLRAGGQVSRRTQQRTDDACAHSTRT